MSATVPVIPETAPFSAEQRAYLNGFLAGLFSRAPAPSSNGGPATLKPLTIVFGSQTGNAEALAKRAAKEAGRAGFAPTVHDLSTYTAAQLAAERHLLVITSTYGDGDPPDNAKPFWELIRNGTAPKLNDLRFAVLALGDSSYPKFCAFGKAVDERLAALGGHAVYPRVDCDVEFEPAFATWINATLAGFNHTPANAVAAPADSSPAVSTAAYGRSNPFPAKLIANRRLNGPGSAKDTRHIAFSLEGSGFEYSVGDALAVRPCNCPALVAELLSALGCSGEESVCVAGRDTSLREGLLRECEVTRVSPALFKALAERSGDAALKELSGEALTQFLHGRDCLDVLRKLPGAAFSAQGFVDLLKRLPPRLYSICSSPRAHPGEVHLCVGVVRYENFGRMRQGVCSTFLAERVALDSAVPVFIHQNRNFRLPADPGSDMIMVGPGTGIAPFRAFLEERRALGARGRNWLFFGDQHAATDFLYREEIESMLRDGTLARLDTAFSRDQPEKLYVQHRMLEHARELFDWLEGGAHFYVCGDAQRMAKDVDRALHEVIERGGGRNAEQAAEYVKKLSATKRYQRDVY